MKKLLVISGLLAAMIFGFHTTLATQYYFGGPYKSVLEVGEILLGVLILVHMTFALIRLIPDIGRTMRDRPYFKLNAVYWTKILSALGIMIFALLHIVAFRAYVRSPGTSSAWFWGIADMLFYLSAFVHLAFVTPHLFISFGLVTGRRSYAGLTWLIRISFLAVGAVVIVARARMMLSV